MTATLEGTRTPAAAMRRVSVRNVKAHKVRLALTIVSVVLGTAFVAGSFVFTDTLKATFTGIFADTAKGVDVRVTATDDRSSGVPLPELATISAIPGAGQVQTQIQSQIVLIGADHKAVQGGGAPSFGIGYNADAFGDPLTFTAGHAPSAGGEIALNEGAVKLSGLHLGSHTMIVVPAQGTVNVTLVGIYSTGADSGGYVGAYFSHDQAVSLFTDGKHVAAVDIAAVGVSPDQLRDRISNSLGGAYTVKTGEQVRADTQASLDTALSFVNYFLLAFGLIALLVGTFIIYNTFSMIVAQRLRELALLRAIGASPRQVSRSVLTEALLVGLVGSVIGLAAGVGLAYGLRSLLNALNFGLPSGPLQLAAHTVIITLAVGVLVTLISAYSPARRAARTPPVEAMRQEFASVGTSLRRRTLIATGLAVLGVVGLILGVVGPGGGGSAGLVGIGMVAAIFAVLVGGASLSRPVVGGIGRLIGRPFGQVGLLARKNAVRNPRRTAATAFALTLGLLLVSAIAVVGASAKSSVNTLVDNGVTADYLLVGPDSIGAPIATTAAAQSVPGVADVVALHPVAVTIGTKQDIGAGVEGDLTQVANIDLVAGSVDLSTGDMMVSATTASTNDWQVGSTATLTSVDGRKVNQRVGGIYRDNQLFGNWFVGSAAYLELVPDALRTNNVVLIKAAGGTDLVTLRKNLENATAGLLVVQVLDRDQFKGTAAAQINALLGILYGLLALAIVIAVLGIINTLALSVVERRREIGMLRAMGMQRSQVRRTIYLESTLIALFGAFVGVALGLVFGSAFVRTLRNDGLAVVSVPWAQAATFVVISAVVGVLAALWPGIRAARTPPLAAIADL